MSGQKFLEKVASGDRACMKKSDTKEALDFPTAFHLAIASESLEACSAILGLLISVLYNNHIYLCDVYGYSLSKELDSFYNQLSDCRSSMTKGRLVLNSSSFLDALKRYQKVWFDIGVHVSQITY
jgi:hypothetical protein